MYENNAPPPPRSFTRAHSERRVVMYKPDVTHLYHDQFIVNNRRV
jgi:hypothetical protein